MTSIRHALNPGNTHARLGNLALRDSFNSVGGRPGADSSSVGRIARTGTSSAHSSVCGDDPATPGQPIQDPFWSPTSPPSSSRGTASVFESLFSSSLPTSATAPPPISSAAAAVFDPGLQHGDSVMITGRQVTGHTTKPVVGHTVQTSDHTIVEPAKSEAGPKIPSAKPAVEVSTKATPAAHAPVTGHILTPVGPTPVTTEEAAVPSDLKCSGDGNGGGGGEGGTVPVIPTTMTETVSDGALRESKTPPAESDLRGDSLIVSEVTSKHRLRPGYLPPPQLDKQSLPPSTHSAPPATHPEPEPDSAPIIRSSAASISLQAGSYAARPFSPTKNLGWQHRRFSKWITTPSEDEGAQSMGTPLKRMMSLKEEAGRVKQPPQSSPASSMKPKPADPKPHEASGSYQPFSASSEAQSSLPRPQLHRQTSHLESRRLSYIPPPMSTVASWNAPPPFSPPPPLQPPQLVTEASAGHTAPPPVQRRAILPYGGAKSDGLIGKHAFVTCNIIAAADRKRRESCSRSTTAEIPPPEQLVTSDHSGLSAAARVASPDPEKVIRPSHNRLDFPTV